MNAGDIWWGQIGNSLRFLEKVTEDLRDNRSAVLRLPRNMPWRQEFYEAVDQRRSAFSAERRLMRLPWNENTDPGKFVMNELCSARVNAEYWAGESYAKYLGSRNDLMLNDYYVWITGVHSKADIAGWAEFIAQYEQSVQHQGARAVFIIEYDGEIVGLSGVQWSEYTVENYDCRVFSLEVAAALGNTGYRNYQAELALSICRNDPELCYELLLTGEKLLQDPMQTAAGVLRCACSPDGRPFDAMNEVSLQSAAWEAAIVLLFPVLERFRMAFISRYKAELSRHLPITNSNKERVEIPQDLEIGSLYYIVNNSGRGFSAEDAKAIALCRNVRNLLAHNRIVPLEDVCSVYALKLEE